MPYHQPNLRHQPLPRGKRRPADASGTWRSPLFAATRDPLLLIDAAQTLRGGNPAVCALLGQSAEELRGQPWQQVFRLERELARDWRHNPVVRCLESRRRQTLHPDTQLVCNGRRHACQGHVLPLADGPRPLALLCLHPAESSSDTRSLSRRGEHELLLQHMARLGTVSELATGIAHEMNQPLTAIMSFNQAAMRLLAEDEPDIDRVAEVLAETVSQTRRAAGILERLRAFVSRQGVALKPVAINQVVINALTLLSNKLGADGVNVALRTEPCPPVLADALQLEQVMVNLLRNAIDAMQAVPPSSRRLSVSTQAIAGRAHVTVTDTGPGLPADTDIFARFFTTKAEGLGLGLSISRTLLEAAGGDLIARNAPDGGATFHFSLPFFTPGDDT